MDESLPEPLPEHTNEHPREPSKKPIEFINEKIGPSSNTSTYVNEAKRQELMASIKRNEESYKKMMEQRPEGSVGILGGSENEEQIVKSIIQIRANKLMLADEELDYPTALLLAESQEITPRDIRNYNYSKKEKELSLRRLEHQKKIEEEHSNDDFFKKKKELARLATEKLKVNTVSISEKLDLLKVRIENKDPVEERKKMLESRISRFAKNT